ncbi:hypothetical protein [Wolbachia endosymbiont of Folsomia candida]|uniref:hypothetical protein n=1 Tax=Wolbachia endosymbiont of Folsomia candida TaxID=169402 RepID=UPI000AFE9FC3|nr:hypothetical protein [Wolbachia endosymbiont of Folsomia candida]
MMVISQKFWEDDLEIPATDLLLRFKNQNVRESWLNSLTGRQLNIILKRHFNHQHQLFDSSAYYDSRSVQQKRKILIDSDSDCLPNYYLVSHFSRLKSDLAIIEVAKPALTIESFLLNNNKCDKKSILFTLFIIDPNLLIYVCHFNKVQKRSFSPFILQNPPRQKSIPFANFLSEEVLQKILKQHDLSADDDFKNKFKGFFYHQNRIYLFIRRASDSDLLLNSNQVIHGYKPDMIILDFTLNANQVNLCTKDIEHGLKIANSIVSQYFELECSFVNIHNQNDVARLRTFLSDCTHESIPDIKLVELKFSPTEPSTYFT